jgi:hypothetical protein
LLVILGRQGEGPGWLLGVLLVVALSVVTDERQAQAADRERHAASPDVIDHPAG